MRYPRLLRSVIRRHTDGRIVAAGRSAVAAKTINAGHNVPTGEQDGLITIYRLASLTALASATQSGQPRQTRLKPRQVDGLADVLHHKRQRHNMGLTIHYQLATTGDEANARKLVQQLQQAALDLPLQHVGEIVEFRGDQCDWKHRADDDPYRWLLVQAGTHISLPVEPWEKRQGVTRHLDVRPQHIIAFETEPGDGCEAANFGLCKFPGELSHPEYGKLKTKLKGWSWHSFCKTHYASDPRCGGLPNFLRCHLGVVALLDEAKKLGVLGGVSDEGEFWETRSLERLTKEIGEQSAMLAGFLGMLKDAMGQAPGGAGTVEAPIAGYPNFEHLEAEGQRLLPEQLKTMLKALARSNLLRGNAG